ncbi:MAG: PIN domain-containing protein [Crocosphaera sp.]|nr:PIN domain-containing protein [Crocosphaera sp.]
MRKILIDTDIILEYLLNRGDFKREAEVLWKMIESRRFEAFVTENGLEKIRFYVSRLTNTNDGIKIIKSLQKKIKICPVNKDIIEEARKSNIRDFDAAIAVICATQMNLDTIVAWKPEYFESEISTIKVLSVSKLFIFDLEESFNKNVAKKIFVTRRFPLQRNDKYWNFINSIIIALSSLLQCQSVDLYVSPDDDDLSLQ